MAERRARRILSAWGDCQLKRKQSNGRYGEIRGDMGRYGEMWEDMGRAPAQRALPPMQPPSGLAMRVASLGVARVFV